MKHQIFLDKRKWQVALRRYILDQQPSMDYAVYFGIDIPGFRGWIENQFAGSVLWENFGKCWQLEHIVPLSYFNLLQNADLKLCWHFTNIQVGPVAGSGLDFPVISIHQAKSYFKALAVTGLNRVNQMIIRLEFLENQNQQITSARLNYLAKSADRNLELEKLDSEELYQINKGFDLNEMLAQKKLFHRFS